MNHETYVLYSPCGGRKAVYTDWEVALKARAPGDYVLVQKDAPRA